MNADSKAHYIQAWEYHIDQLNGIWPEMEDINRFLEIKQELKDIVVRAAAKKNLPDVVQS